jgi:hypothetical protein
MSSGQVLASAGPFDVHHGRGNRGTLESQPDVDHRDDDARNISILRKGGTALISET